MTYHGKYKRMELPECPVCGMYAGKRMMSETEPPQYYVVCEVCGFKTRPHPTQSAASHEWTKRKRVGKD